MPNDLKRLLRENPYPGRGIVIGSNEDGIKAYIAYFIMGRSANSRNRIFVEHDDAVYTEAADEAKVEDPSLIIYAPVRRLGDNTIVTNGDQTDTVYQYLEEGRTFEEALRTRTFEPDAPNYTPRISGLVHIGYGGLSYKLAILKSEGAGQSARRVFWEYPEPLCGQGHFLHTYAAPGDPLPSFVGEPVEVAISGSIDQFGQGIWEALNADNKISLFVRSISLDGDEDTRVYNKYSKV